MERLNIKPNTYTIDETRTYDDQSILESFKNLIDSEDYPPTIDDLISNDKLRNNYIDVLKEIMEGIPDKAITNLKKNGKKFFISVKNQNSSDTSMQEDDTSNENVTGISSYTSDVGDSSYTSVLDNSGAFSKIKMRNVGDNHDKFVNGNAYIDQQYIPSLIQKVVGGNATKLVGTFEDEDQVDNKVHLMMIQLMYIGLEKHNNKHKTDGKAVPINKQSIQSLFKLENTIDNILATLTLANLRAFINNGNSNNKGGLILYYKALKACKSSKVSTYKISLTKKAKSYGNEIMNTGDVKDYSQSIKDPKVAQALSTNKISMYLNQNVWNSSIDGAANLTSSEIMLNESNALFNACVHYGVITTADVNALIQPFFDEGFVAAKWIRTRSSIGLEEIPTSAFEIGQVKKTEAALKSAKKKLYKESTKTGNNSVRERYIRKLKLYE